MLRLSGGQVETLFDLGMPVEVAELPADLAGLDRLLEGTALLRPIVRSWDLMALTRGRPTIPMERFVRLMLVKQRSGWGYETLVREVSDSLHLRRFCLIPLVERVPDESTIRKLVRRLGPEVIEEICRELIAKATTGRGRFLARAGPDRLDRRRGRRALSHRSRPRRRRRPDARPPGIPRAPPGRCGRAARRRSLAGGEAAPAHALAHPRPAHRHGLGDRPAADRRGGDDRGALDRRGPPACGSSSRTRARAGGDGQARCGRPSGADHRAGAEGARADPKAPRRRAHQRPSRALADPDARPIRKGKLRAPTEFGYVVQIAELTESTRRGARGLILAASSRIGAAAESDLLPATAADMARLGLRPRELALDGGFFPNGVAEQLPDTQRTFIAGRQSAGSRRTNRRLARYRVGCEGRISHLKRRYGLRRSRLRGHQGARTWVAWAILAYNLDTLAVRAA